MRKYRRRIYTGGGDVRVDLIISSVIVGVIFYVDRVIVYDTIEIFKFIIVSCLMCYVQTSRFLGY